jgi:hypothetical protein
MKLDERRYVSGAACSARAQADFHNFVRERRNPSALPGLGSQRSACRSRPSRVKTKCNFDVYVPKASALKTAVGCIVWRRVSIRNTVLISTSKYFSRPNIWKRPATMCSTSGMVVIQRFWTRVACLAGKFRLFSSGNCLRRHSADELWNGVDDSRRRGSPVAMGGLFIARTRQPPFTKQVASRSMSEMGHRRHRSNTAATPIILAGSQPAVPTLVSVRQIAPTSHRQSGRATCVTPSHPCTYAHALTQRDRVGRFDPNSSSLTPRSNPHSARCPVAAPHPAISCLGASRTPAPEHVDGIGIPASEKPAQKRTHAVQQTAALFDYFIGALLHKQRHLKAERLGGLEIDHQLKFGRYLHRQI